MSIAITQLHFKIPGLVGLDQIYDILRATNTKTPGAYAPQVNKAIQEILELKSIDPSKVHAYENDLHQIYFTILAFKIFGIKFQALLYLWVSIFFASILGYLIAFFKRPKELIFFWCLFVGITFAIFTIPAIGQLLSIHNHRCLSILAIIPFFHILFSIQKFPNSILNMLILLMQCLLFNFAILARSSEQWMLGALVLITLFLFLDNWKNKSYKKSFGEMLPSSIIPLFLILLFFLMKLAPSSHLHPEYKKDIWDKTHLAWATAVAGFAMDPNLYNSHICSDKKIRDQLVDWQFLKCRNPVSTWERLKYAVAVPPNDMTMYHAAVKYLRDNGSDEKLGSTYVKVGHFNMKWKRFEEISKLVVFQMIKESPLDVMFTLLVVKPLRYVNLVLERRLVFLRTMSNEQFTSYPNSLLFSLIIGLVFTFHLIIIFIARKSNIFENVPIINPWIFAIVYLSSLIPSFLFYSVEHSVTVSVSILIAFLFYYSIMYEGKIWPFRGTAKNSSPS